VTDDRPGVVAGMNRQGYDLDLTQYPEAWRCTFFTTGRERSLSSRAGTMRGSAVIWILLAVGVSGCASPSLNSAQQQAVAAFKDCQRTAVTADLIEIYEDGRFVFTARPDDNERMLQCLAEKHGYKHQ